MRLIHDPRTRSPAAPRLVARATLLGALLLLGACNLRPEPITADQHLDRARADFAALQKNYIPHEGRLDLATAIARTLKYNYDTQLAKAETTLQERQVDLAFAQMLPRLAADAGYNWRTNHNSARSVSERTGLTSLDYSYSEEPRHYNADLELSWNLLDAGVSYFQAKQQGYRALVALERRRKVIENILRSVTDTYWRAAAAEELLPQVDPLLARAQKVLDGSRAASRNGLQPQLATLDFQHNLLQVITELHHMRADLTDAKIQLASLINVPPTQKLVLVPVSGTLAPQSLNLDMSRLEETGLALRPELRVEAYQEKIDRQDIYKEMIRMMPGIGVLGSVNYDSNRYLYNNAWGVLGVRATWNLISLIQGPKAIAVAEQSLEITQQRRLALSVAALTQINLTYRQYLSTLDDLKMAEQAAEVEGEIQKYARNAGDAGSESEAEVLRRNLSGLVARLQRDRSAAAVHTALAGVYSSVGVDLVPPSADFDDLPTLTERVSAAIAGWEAGQLPELVPAKTAAAEVPAPIVAAASLPPPAAKPVSVVRKKPAKPAVVQIVASVTPAG